MYSNFKFQYFELSSVVQQVLFISSGNKNRTNKIRCMEKFTEKQNYKTGLFLQRKTGKYPQLA